MKKFFSLVLALVMALSLTTVAWGATADVDTLQELKDAIAAGNDINVTGTVAINENITIDLTGLTVTNNVAGGHMFNIVSPATEVTIKGGTLTIPAGNTTSHGFVDINAAGAKVVVNGGTYSGDLDLSGVSSYVDRPAFFTNPASGVNLELNNVVVPDTNYFVVWAEDYYNTLTVTGGNFASEKCPFIAAAVGAGVNVKFTNVVATTAKGGVVEVNGANTNAEFVNCTMTTTSADYGAAPATAVSVTFGASLTIKGGTYTGSANAATDGKNALAIYPTGGSITVESGTLDGDVKMWNSDSTKDYEVTISGGTVTGEFETTASEDIDVTVSGGSFPNADVTDYLAEGYRFDAATGEVTAMPATGVGKYDLYDQDGDLAEENITAEYTDSYEKKGAGNIGYWKLTVDGVTYSYYIECSRTKAEMYLTLADNTGVYKYLKHVEYVDYVATGKAYTNIGDDCGELDVGAKAKAYVLADEDGNKTYWIADEDGDTVIMVGDELVLVSEVEGGLVPHTWVVTAYNDDEEPITAKCKECPATAKLYKTKLAAPVGATFAGQIAGYYVVVDGTLPSTDKVTSAETFDAGIAMYVGMSVMAAAGSAVVIGKKRED